MQSTPPSARTKTLLLSASEVSLSLSKNNEFLRYSMILIGN